MTAGNTTLDRPSHRSSVSWSSRLQRARPVAFIVVLGLVATALVLSVMGRMERNRLESAFNSLADGYNASVKRTIEEHVEVLAAIGALYDANDTVDREQFTRFVTPLLQRHPGIQALEWLPRITDARRDEWEQSIRAEGLEDFRITERGPEGKMIRAARRSEYFPVVYVEPMTGNSRALGFDVASTPVRRSALDQATRTGRLVGTEPVAVVQETGEQLGMVVFLAKHSPAGQPAGPHGETLAGYLTAVFRFGDVVEAAVGTLETAGVDIVLTDVTEPLHQRILVRRRSSTRGPDDSPDPVPGTQQLQRQLVFALAGRTWRVTATPAPAFLLAHRSLMPIVAPGLLVAGLATGCVIMLIGRAARVEALVSTHTQKLTAINEQQERTNLELQHRNQEILRLCYAMTHDLQTPLASLAGGVDALEHRLDGASPAQMKWMDRIRGSAQRMVGMLDDLMVYARMGTEEIESEPVNLGDPVRIAIDELQAQATQKGIRIDFSEDLSRPCIVIGDQKIIVRVLMNLLSNAIKYVEADADGTVKITMVSRGEFVRIGVQDSGPGITPALLDEVFEPFRRASPGTTGTGLGLSIVRRYVTTMGGRVWLESDGRTGTTAFVELPSATANREHLAA